MNMSGVCKVSVEPSGGDTYSVTCFVCGMPSSKDWAERVRTKPPSGHQHHHQVPFYPCLLDMVPAPPGAILMEDGSTWLCAFCHALLEAQWNNYENKSERIPPIERSYNVHKFICAVCAVETYRKRVRALPFQEFPFLVKNRQPNSITLVNNPVAIVCLDCSETLWAQSNEYDRWGLPIHKRHFNWMARPPPPEDSVEATVARLPSGETQLPRCPPTDPLVPPKTNEPTAMPEAIAPLRSNKPKAGGAGSRYDVQSQSHPLAHSGSSRHNQQQQHPQELAISMHQPHSAVSSGSGRKTSVGPTTSPALDLAGPHSQPPVVTVAPMSTQHTLTNTRKDSMSHIPSQSQHNKYDIVTVTQVGGSSPSTHRSSTGSNSGHHASSLFHQTPLFSPSGSYPGPFPWPASLSSRDTELPPGHPSSPFNHYGNNPLQSPESLPNPPTWPWLQPTSPELLRYQSYISSLQSRGLADSYFASGAGLYPPSSTISSIATYLPSLHTQQSSIGSPSPPAHFAHTSSSAGTAAHQQQHNLMLQQHGAHHQATSRERESPPTQVSGNTGNRSVTSPHSQYHKLTKTYIIQSEEEPVPLPRQSTSSRSSSKSSLQSSNDSSSKEKSVKIDIQTQDFQGSEHINSKSKKNISKRTSPTLKLDSSPRESAGSGSTSKRIDMIHPKKRHWQPQPSASDSQNLIPSSPHDKNEEFQPLDKKRKFSLTLLPQGEQTSEPMDFTVKRKLSVPNQPQSVVSKSPKTCQKKDYESTRETAMDLSLPSTSNSASFRSRTTSCPTSSKFSIAYLCKSESVSPPCVPLTSEEPSSSNSRSSVIVTTPLTKDKQEKDSPKNEDIEETLADKVDAPVDDEKTDENKVKETKTEEDNSSKIDSADTVETQTSDLTLIQESSPQTETVEMDNQSETQVVDPSDEPAENKKSDKDEDKKNTAPIIETQINMVTIGDIRIAPEDFVRKTIEIFVNEEKEVEIKRKKQLNKQLDFLSCLGLITPEKKMELELETLANRSNKNTIPPLKLRIESPPLETIDEEIEQQLLQVAFDDPSLKQNSVDPEKSHFLKHLGLKPCSKYDKSRREVIWRQILTERFMRVKRNDKLYGVKRPWDTYTKVSKLLTFPKRIACSCRPNSFSECLTSLSLTLPKELEEMNGPRRNSSDLLTTVEATQTITPKTTTSDATDISETNSVIFKNGICINYPKYIPSYVLTAQLKEEEGKTDEMADQPKPMEILNVPSVTPMTSFPTSPPATTTVGVETILRIPVINSSSTSLMTSSRRSSNSTLQTTTSDESDGDVSSTEIEIKDVKKELDGEKSRTPVNHPNTGNQPTKNGSSCQWSDVEGILKASTAQWEKTKKVMEEALRQTDYLQSKENQKLLEDGAAHFRAIRRHLKTQQADMKQTEKLFKGKEKEVIKKLRTLTKYSNSKDAT